MTVSAPQRSAQRSFSTSSSVAARHGRRAHVGVDLGGDHAADALGSRRLGARSPRRASGSSSTWARCATVWFTHSAALARAPGWPIGAAAYGAGDAAGGSPALPARWRTLAGITRRPRATSARMKLRRRVLPFRDPAHRLGDDALPRRFELRHRVLPRRQYDSTPRPIKVHAACAGCERYVPRVDPDCLRDVGEAVAQQQRAQLGDDVARERRAAIDEAGVGLHQRGAGANLLVGVGAARDAADADDRQVAAAQSMQRAHDRRRPGAQRRPAEAAGLARLAVAARQHAAVDGGVGGDDAGDALRAHRRDHGGQGVVGEVGRDLHQQRSRGDAGGAGEAAILVLHGGEQRRELRLGLQVAQAGRVRRADVEDEIVGEAVQRAQARAVVVRGALERRGLRLAEVDAERHRAAVPRRAAPRARAPPRRRRRC